MTQSDPPGSSHAGARWADDPWRGHQYRWWDGTSWTEHVSDYGTTSVDPAPFMQGAPGSSGWGAEGTSYQDMSYGQQWPAAAPAHLSFFGAVGRCLSNYANFKSRAALGEYWWFALFVIALLVGLALLELALFQSETIGLAAVAWLALITPQLAVTARRLHDTNKTGWLQLISFIPLVGPILMIVWLASAGDPRPNQWGPAPQ